MMRIPPSLLEFRASQMAEPVAAAFHVPVAALQARFGASLSAVLLYGSCRRQQDAIDGVVDLYAIVNDYAAAYPGRWLRWLNGMLPPNVFYLKVPADAGVLRVKYALLSEADFERGIAHGFHPYLWARFCQPAALLHARDAPTADRICAVLSSAVLRFLDEVVPMMSPGPFNAESLWTTGFRLTYGAELRPESADRAEVLVRLESKYYRTALELAAIAVPGLENAGGGFFRVACSDARIGACDRAWRRRRRLGGVLSLLRLAKSSFTFSGGVDYAAWKVERHTGVHIEVTPQLRRFPLLFGWRVVWQLLRRGTLR